MFGILTGRKSDLANSAVLALYLALAAAVVLFDALPIRLLLLALAGAAGILGWALVYKRYRLIADTPSSRVSSAAQGYVELTGRAELHPGSPPIGFMSGPPCVWYRYVVYRRSNERWQVVSRDQSEDTFILDDGSGRCVIDPDDAEIITSHRKSWTSGDYRHVVEYLAPGDTLYALGRLYTQSSGATPLSKREDIRELLAEWKRDPQSLLNRFDANRDGQLDMQEWQAAREAAEQQVDAQHREFAQRADLHIMRAPEDGSRPFLLANRDPQGLADHYRWWSWVHLAAFACAAMAAVFLGSRA